MWQILCCHTWSPSKSSGKIGHRRRVPEAIQTRGGVVVTFEEVLTQTVAMLQRLGRVSYRTLKRQFDLDDAYLEDLKDAILYTHPTVIDDVGRGLIWPSEVDTPLGPPPSSAQPAPQPVP